MNDDASAPSHAQPLFAAERWRRMRALFDELADADPRRREAELARIASTDAALAASLRDLLVDDASPSRAPGTRADGQRMGEEPMPARIGPFRLLEHIGAGGMGRVFLAERDDADFVQRVALKLLDGGSARLARLASRERRILAALAHPHITTFVDAGTQDGHAWMAMEYVPGETLLEHCRSQALGVRERVQLFDQVCAAVAHAHAQLVVHRDLKPSNILVGADGRAKLLDFGIALMLDDETDAPATRVFTPEYAAPEQLRGERATTASDVYSLGLVLYELVVGKRLASHARAERDGEWTTAELARSAIEVTSEQSTPTRLPSETRALSTLLRGDLGRIIARTLDPQPARRYASVASLREDLARWRDDRPLTIGRSGRWDGVRRFVRRHRLGVTAAGFGLAAIVALAATALWQARAKSHEAALARAALRQSEATRDFINSVFLSADPYQGKGAQTTAGELLAAARTRIDRDLAAEPEVAAALLLQIGHVQASLFDRDATVATMRKALDYNARSAAPSTILEGSARARLAFESSVTAGTEEALRGLAQAIALLRNAGPDAHPELAGALRMQGNLLFSADPGEGAAATAEAVTLLEPLGPGRATEFLGSLQVLADMLASQGRNAEALAAAERGLVHPEALGADRATLRAQLEGTRARALTGLERYPEAEIAMAIVIDDSRATFGPEHASTRYWRYRRAELLDAMGRVDEAAAETQSLIDVAATSDEHPMASMAHLITAAGLSEERRAATTAVDIERARDVACGSGGHPLFCSKAHLLEAEAAIRERRFADASASMEICGNDESIAATPRLARQLALLRVRLARESGRSDAARDLLQRARGDAAMTPREIALLDVESGYLALAASDRASATALLTRARDQLMRSLSTPTPRIREIDAALQAARRER